LLTLSTEGKAMNKLLKLLMGIAMVFALSYGYTQGTAMDRTALITQKSFDVKVLANGVDVTAKSPVAQVKYNADGTGTRTLRDGKTVTGSWKYSNPQQTQIEVTGPEGTSRWIVVELSASIYRKVNIDTGVEFIHLPQ
jgi:hypothetical protein